MDTILFRLQVIWLDLTYLFRKTYTANICWHQTKRVGKITSSNGHHTMSMPLSKNGSPDYCLNCIAKMSIECAWCKGSIWIGDPVTLYIPAESFQIPEHAVKYHEDERRLVGCLGWDCAKSGVDRQGFWMPPGKVARVPSPIEMLLSGGNDNKAVIVGDLSDPSNLGKTV